MINPDNDNAVHGKEIEVERIAGVETRGNTTYKRDRQVNHNDPITVRSFGILESRVYNEKNANKSRRVDTHLKTDSIVETLGAEYDGLQALGADKVIVKEKIVDITAGAAPDETQQGHLFLSSTVKALDSMHGQRETKEVTEWAARVSTNKADSAADGEETTTTEQVVSGATAWPARTVNTLDLSRKHIGDDKYRQFHKVAASRPTLVSYEEEPTTGYKVTVTRTITATNPGLATTGTARQVKTVKHAAKDRWVTTTREIHADILSAVLSEWHPVEFSFPSYLDADEPFIILEIENNQTLINTLKSSPQRLKVPCLFEFRYYTAVPTIADVFQFKPVDIVLRTADGVISENGVLTDGATIALRITPNLELLRQRLANGEISYPTYLTMAQGYEVDFEFPPSSPTTTEYLAMMGDTVQIAHDVTRWKYNLWREVKVWMRLPNLATNLDGSLTY